MGSETLQGGERGAEGGRDGKGGAQGTVAQSPAPPGGLHSGRKETVHF